MPRCLVVPCLWKSVHNSHARMYMHRNVPFAYAKCINRFVVAVIIGWLYGGVMMEATFLSECCHCLRPHSLVLHYPFVTPSFTSFRLFGAAGTAYCCLRTWHHKHVYIMSVYVCTWLAIFRLYFFQPFGATSTVAVCHSDTYIYNMYVCAWLVHACIL